MRRIDEMDIITIDGITCCKGHPLPFGATLLGSGRINFSINSADAEGCALQLYHSGEESPFAEIPVPEAYRIGNNYAIIVFDQNPEELEYTYRFYGRYDPPAGYRFNPEICLLDPYAKLLSGREVWGRKRESAVPLRGKIIQEDFPWEGDQALEIPFEDLVIYETHVRGLTCDPASPAKKKGTFAGIIEMIPYFKELGVNCIELLPVFEFDELENPRTADGKPLYNYWGYSTVSFFAPKSAYAFSGIYGLAADEMKNMVKHLHLNGIEVILDVVFNHTAEMGDGGPTLNYRGIDNRTYYHLDEKGDYLNYSGCGNTVNCNNVVVRQYILDCLRYWVSDYHVDGFRFDEAPILSRDVDGTPMQSPPLLESLAHDPILSRAKLIAEAWDAAGLYQVGSFPAPDRWAEWNGRFRDCVRRFIKGDASAGPELIQRVQGSPDMYGGSGSSHSTVNFITCHDGFTMNDLVSYNEKHNYGNGEENRDGVDYNISWNCGAEGPTDDPEIEALRNRQVKNAFALLMTSRGTPMMSAGDEFRNSQNGNNNVYCQDSPVSWLNWKNKKRHADVYSFYRAMIRLRREHPVLRRRGHFTDRNSSGYPELSFHGEKAWNLNMWDSFLTFAFMYAEPKADFGTKYDCFIYCAFNAHWEDHDLELPLLPEGMRWYLYADPAGAECGKKPVDGGSIHLGPRSCSILLGK
ncbi:MAG: alpha-amylase family glycosyl hydrolase [Eubacteriales bacterium]|nr:alpha-amylase family glycosyl hydrolase [Eubacteriales bacterium]